MRLTPEHSSEPLHVYELLGGRCRGRRTWGGKLTTRLENYYTITSDLCSQFIHATTINQCVCGRCRGRRTWGGGTLRASSGTSRRARRRSILNPESCESESFASSDGEHEERSIASWPGRRCGVPQRRPERRLSAGVNLAYMSTSPIRKRPPPLGPS